jgi:phage tail-like protein
MATLSSLGKTLDIGAPAIPPGPATNGHKPPSFPDGEEPAPSSYLKYLPAIYSADEFVGRFLRIFEDVLRPVEEMVDNQPYYFDPLTTPKHLLDWMDIWVDMDNEGEDWPLPRRRKLLESAAVLYRMRGTAAGVKLHLGIYSGGLVLVEERTNGFRLGQDSRLGINTSIGEDRPRLFTVTIASPDPETLDMDTFRAIIEADKPVDTTYILRVVKMDLKLPKQPPPRW